MNDGIPIPAVQTRTSLRERYDRMWSKAIGVIRAGSIESDPVLAAGLPDRRRGLTLIIRPPLNVRQCVAAFIDSLRVLEPEQHYYIPTELHLTVLSLFTATDQPEPFLARRKNYVAAVAAALRGIAPFPVEFVGVTASSSAIMIQGFAEGDALNTLRNILRHQLQVHDLGHELDGRYRLETAHVTIARFRSRLRDGTRLAVALQGARTQAFGATCVRSVSLVENDWYMSKGVTETLKRFRLIRPV